MGKRTKIEFCVESADLTSSLNQLSPFIDMKDFKVRYNEENDYTYYDAEKVRYNDKVIFVLCDNFLKLKIIKNKIKVSVDCPMKGSYENIEFCVSMPYLIQILSKIDPTTLYFQEDLFFGFVVYDDNDDTELFDLQAFSTRNLFEVHHNNTYNVIHLESNILLDTLIPFAKYGDHDLFDFGQIFYFINNGECTVLASDRARIAFNRYTTSIGETLAFCIPCKYALQICDMIKKWKVDFITMEYNNTNSRIHHFDNNSSQNISIEISRVNPNLDFSIFEKILKPKRIVNKAIIDTLQLKTFLKRAQAWISGNNHIYLYFGKNTLKLYIEAIFEYKNATEWYNITNTGDEFYLKIYRKHIDEIAEDLHSPKTKVFVNECGYVYFLNEEETVGGTSQRFVCCCILKENDMIIAEKLKKIP